MGRLATTKEFSAAMTQKNLKRHKYAVGDKVVIEGKLTTINVVLTQVNGGYRVEPPIDGTHYWNEDVMEDPYYKSQGWSTNPGRAKSYKTEISISAEKVRGEITLTLSRSTRSESDERLNLKMFIHEARQLSKDILDMCAHAEAE